MKTKSALNKTASRKAASQNTSLRRRAAGLALATATGLGAGFFPAAQPVASAQGSDLSQVVTGDEAIAPEGEKVVVESGHIDIGAMVIDGELHILARDDRSQPPVWRHLDDMVFQLRENAVQTLPDNDDFSFVGAGANEPAYVVPQTEIAAVPWLGWNTQAPALTDNVHNGVNMDFLGHSGPGEFALFLQNGGFEAPDVLWSTVEGKDDDFFVELHTHTHANWTFTDPGVHQVGLQITATTHDGQELSAQEAVTFAVGEDTDPVEAHNAVFDWENASTGSSGFQISWLLVGGIAIVVVLVGVGVASRGKKK